MKTLLFKKAFIIAYMFFSTLIGALLLLDPNQVTLIIGLGNTFVTLFLGLFGLLYVKNKVKAVDSKLDGTLSKLVEASKEASHAQGKEQGRDQEISRAASVAPTATEVTIVENLDKEVIIKKNLDK